MPFLASHGSNKGNRYDHYARIPVFVQYYMTKLGTVVHNENTVPLKSTEENLNFSSCSMNVGELFIRFICCDRAVPALLRTVSAFMK